MALRSQPHFFSLLLLAYLFIAPTFGFAAPSTSAALFQPLQQKQGQLSYALRIVIPDGYFIYDRLSTEKGNAATLQLRSKRSSLDAILWPLPEIIKDKQGDIVAIQRKNYSLILHLKVNGGLTEQDQILFAAELCAERSSECTPISHEIKLSSSKNSDADYSRIFTAVSQQQPVPLTQNSNQLSLLEAGWNKPPLPGKERHYSLSLSLKKSREQTIEWRQCRMITLANQEEWLWGKPSLASKGETGQDFRFQFSIPVQIPEKLSKAAPAFLQIQCPGLNPPAYLYPVDLTEKRLFQANQQDQSLWQPEPVSSSSQESGFLAWITMMLFAFLGGLILNVMPCVLPVISIKVFSLVKQAGEDARTIFRYSLFFVLGVLSTFLALALMVIVLKSLGENIGWGFQFQSREFVIGLSLVLLIFGLSLFNVFTLNIPQTGPLGRLAVQGGAIGSYSQGVLATILATPCSAPFLGSAMGFAFSQGAWNTLSIFFMAGLGMASPYMILALFPRALRFIPKPGEWMETLKQFMGFLLFATLLWLIWVYSRGAGSEATILLLSYLFAVTILVWAGGRIAPLGSASRRYILTWITIVLFGVGLTWYFLPQLMQASTSQVKTTITGSITWENFSPEKLQTARAGKNPVFLKFTADWCLTCKANEKTVLALDSVAALFQKYGVVPISADWTNGDQAITSLLQSFGRSGVPFYVIYRPGNGAAIPLSEVITPGTIEEALREAAKP